MTTINTNLTNLYNATQQKNAAQQKVDDLKEQKKAAKTQAERNEIQKQINAANKELTAAKNEYNAANRAANNDKSLFSTSNSSTLTYQDVVTLTSGVDLDGDGVVSDEEKAFLNSKQSSIASKYNVNKDTTLKNATTEELNAFTTAISNTNITSSSLKNDINKITNSLTNNSKTNETNAAKTTLGISSNNTKANMTTLVENENKLETAKALLNREITKQEAEKVLGSDVSKVTTDYVETLGSAIDTYKTNNKITDNSSYYKQAKTNAAKESLGISSTSNNKENATALVKNENKLETAKALLAGTISEEEAAKDLGDDVSKVTADYVKTLETAIDTYKANTSVANSNYYKTAKKEVGSSAGATATAQKNMEEINNSEDEKLKSVISQLPDNEKELLNSIDITATFSNGQPKYTIAKGGNDKTYHIYEYKDDSGKSASTLVSVKSGNNNLSVKNTGSSSSSQELIHVTNNGTKEVGTGEYEKVLVGTETVKKTEQVKTGTEMVKVGTEQKWVDAVYETVPPEKTEAEVADLIQNAKDEIDSSIGEILSVSGNVLENVNETSFGTQEAIGEYKNGNEYAPATEAAIAAAKKKFLNTVKDHIKTTLGETLANEFARVCIDEYPAKKTSEEFNALADSQKDKYNLTEKETEKKTYKLTDEEKESGMDVRYKKYSATYDIEKSDRETIVNNLLDKLFGTINSTKPTQKLVSEGHYEEVDIYEEKDVYETKTTYEKVPIYEEREKTKTVTDITAESTDAKYSTASPLALDTNSDGVKTSSEMVNFDIDGDGKLDLINDSADAVLVFDADGNGITGESGLEVFGNNTDLDGDGKADGFKNGFDALRALGEKEGLLGGNDLTLDEADITKLKEKYGLGVKFGYLGETQSLSDIGVTEINFGKSNETQTIENFDGQGNNLMTQEGATFKINGKTNVFADIWHRMYDEDEDEE